MDRKQQNLYSRQIGAIGKDAMKNISNLSVFIIGLDTIGIEISKCLCLLGIKKLYINDSRKLSKNHTLRNYAVGNEYVNKSQIGDNSLHYLKKLNSYVDVEVSKIKISVIKSVDILIQTKFTKILSFTPIQINNLCRKNNVKYIFSSIIGLTGYIFNDFGESHTINDIDGEKHKTCYIKSMIYKEHKTIIELDNNGNSEKFNIGDKFLFLNSKNKNIYKIINITKNIITLDEKIEIMTNENNLYIRQVKDKIKIKHLSLNQICNKTTVNPDISINNHTINDNIKILNDMHKLCLNPSILGNECTNFEYILNTKYEFPIIGSMIGGIVSTEIIKIGGKYKPISQECVIDYSELYNRKLLYKSQRNYKFRDINNLLTKKTIKYLESINIFIAGCGALGCEYLKLLAMLNISQKKGLVTVTDMDHIELSNLNRQFLFNNNDIGQSKSKTACQKIKYINSKMKTKALTYKLEKDTENIFNRNFWETQDIVINALDNVQARQYVDSKCVLYKKPLFESGTLGTKCNGQVIIPFLTKSYSETRDPVENAIPVCTIKNFPFKIEHCIEWSLEIFNSYFHDFIKDLFELNKGIDQFKNYIKSIDNENILYEKLQIMVLFKECLENPTIDNIYKFSIKIFEKHFINNIKQILFSFPHEHLDADGNAFWKGNKLPPKLINFNDNTYFTKFLNIFSKILCRCLGIDFSIKEFKNINFSKYIPSKYIPSKYIPDKNYKFKVKETDTIKQGYNIKLSQKIEELFEKLNLKLYPKFTFNIEEFEKDQDSNNHIEFINIISNIRAIIYNIEPIEFLKCKLIAGKIVPALSTTTTLITSIMIMEMIKYVTNTVEPSIKIKYNDIFINSGINFYIQSDPQKSKKIISGQYSDLYGSKIKAIPESFSIWDTIRIIGKKGIFSINDLIENLKDEYSIEIDMLNINDSILYSKYDTNINYTFIDLYTKFNINKNEYLILDITSFTNENIPIISPKLVYTLYI